MHLPGSLSGLGGLLSPPQSKRPRAVGFARARERFKGLYKVRVCEAQGFEWRPVPRGALGGLFPKLAVRGSIHAIHRLRATCAQPLKSLAIHSPSSAAPPSARGNPDAAGRGAAPYLDTALRRRTSYRGGRERPRASPRVIMASVDSATSSSSATALARGK